MNEYMKNDKYEYIEIFTPIYNLENMKKTKYLISDCGTILNTKRLSKTGEYDYAEVKPAYKVDLRSTDPEKYARHRVTLNDVESGLGNKAFFVSRLMWLMFNLDKIPEDFFKNPRKYEVDHIDDNTKNDWLGNLQLMTSEENRIKRRDSGNFKCTPVDTVRKVCEALVHSTDFSKIAKNNRILYATVSEIYNRESYVDISKDYIFKEKNKNILAPLSRNKGKKLKYSDLTVEMIHTMCDLKIKGYSLRAISRHMNVDFALIQRLFSGSSTNKEFIKIIKERICDENVVKSIKKISEDDILKVIDLLKKGFTTTDVARILGYDHRRVWRIQNAKHNLNILVKIPDLSWMTDEGRSNVEKYKEENGII